jgi:translation initiation factor 3 subunit J
LNILQRKHCDGFGVLQQRLREEAERKAKETESKQEVTAEEILAEKMRQQKLQEESDLRVAIETFGVSHSWFPVF